MPTVTIQETQARLPDLIHRLSPGDEVVLTENNEPVAKLVCTEPKTQWPCKAGMRQGNHPLDGPGLRCAASGV